ncbi:hypothetical protein [Bacterioplanoides sp. SCSIO 12839]|uniref:hypothetical protein n=1 Tax=Bacterioplanoides sp. SCSIO 12839 TaxID=2829569 RepID=UPI0021061C41|nr:hypothetical protein [Bacterioplanoides sp. SCSIO 12839]UTW49586.1 hypothetical protein KFF03_06770 [Bacterioplanoides sp. SCSIO 12839]
MLTDNFYVTAIWVHLGMVLFTIATVAIVDVVNEKQKKAQALFSLVVPYLGPIIIFFFTINNSNSNSSNQVYVRSKNHDSNTDATGFHAGHQHNNSSDNSD